jgi:restriction endonuclease S subunit
MRGQQKGVVDTEQGSLYELPGGWVWTKLGEIISFEYGKGLKADKRENKGNIPVYGSNGIVGYHSIPLIEKPCLIIGRKGAAGYVHISNVPCWAIDTTYYIIPPDELNLVFLYFILSTLNLNSLDKSTAIPGLNRNDAYDLYIPLPPLLEQRALVAKIEQLFSDLDNGIANLKKAQEQLKIYRQAVLKKAFVGELTRKWREEQTDLPSAEELLLQIKEERKKQYQKQLDEWKKAVKEWEDNGKDGKKPSRPKKPKELPPLSEVELKDLPELPDGWCWVKFGNVCLKIFDGTHFSPKNCDDGVYKYITAKNIKEGRFDLSQIS